MLSSIFVVVLIATAPDPVSSTETSSPDVQRVENIRSVLEIGTGARLGGNECARTAQGCTPDLSGGFLSVAYGVRFPNGVVSWGAQGIAQGLVVSEDQLFTLAARGSASIHANRWVFELGGRLGVGLVRADTTDAGGAGGVGALVGVDAALGYTFGGVTILLRPSADYLTTSPERVAGAGLFVRWE